MGRGAGFRNGRAWRWVCGVGLTLLMLCGQILAAKTRHRVSSQDLGGRDRYLAYVCTDKPIYRAGEQVFLRSVLLNAEDRRPWPGRTTASFRILGPRGETVASGYSPVQDSVAGFAWQVPEGLAGGEYRAEVAHPDLGTPPASRTFDVRLFRAPRLKSRIRFLRDGYGPGDTVVATLEVTRAEGGIPDGARVTITARVDGREVHRAEARVTAAGTATARFPLPGEMARGEGTLACAVEDGGVVETATKTIPILLQTVDLRIYPEGGELVAGLPCRVYLEGRTPAQKPADLAGLVVDEAGVAVTTFRTEHEGRGRFTLTPRQGKTYTLRITEPAGIRTRYPLPPVKAAGAVLATVRDVYPREEPVELRVRSTARTPVTLTLSKRERELATVTFKPAGSGDTPLEKTALLPLPADADGVLVATLWDGEGNALAERLVYRQPAARVRVEVRADQPRYVPGGRAELTLRTTDEAGTPLSAVVGLTVTDDSVLEMIEKREQAPRLPVMVLLEADVRELADAHVYLDPSNPRAPLAVDLLLGTQGWRRFAFVRTADFLQQHGNDARRVLALRTVTDREQAERSRLAVFAQRAGGAGVRDAIQDAPVMAAAPRPAPAAVDKTPAGKPAAQTAPPPLVAARPEPREALIAGEARLTQMDLRSDRNAERMAGGEGAPAFATVRVYAHEVRRDRTANDRVDFAETLYWHAGIRTDARTGEAQVSFGLNDAVTSFRVLADAFTADGALGAHAAVLESVQPFFVEPKLPLEVTMGDQVRLPVTFVNGTPAALRGVAAGISTSPGVRAEAVKPFDLGADARVRRIVGLAVGDVMGETDFVLSASAGSFSDQVARKLRVAPRGFPVEVAQGGMLAPNTALRVPVRIPATRIPGSLTTRIAVYPTPLANLTEALARLIQEPNGCFEQASSTTYPLVMAQAYFLSHQGVDPALVERSADILGRGYQRLVSFECRKKGYEWFGEDPGHEALSAYGLLQFTDMARVRTVDPDMLRRTRAWLLDARDGKGGFRRERRALHTWIEDADCSNAYVVWALLESGEPVASLKPEIAKVEEAALVSANSYVTALGANVALLADDRDTGRKLMDKLAAAQTADGAIGGATASIVGSGGNALAIETTALTVLAWLRQPEYAGRAETSMKWLADSCQGGRFGSTQATVLALRAIVAYDQARARPKTAGSVSLYVDGRPAGSAREFDRDAQGALLLADIAELLEPGEHTIEVRMQDGAEMPCSLAIRYANEVPDTSPECAVAVEVALANPRIREGSVTEARVRMRNRAGEAVPMPVAILGIPGGLEVRHDQLKELVKARTIAAYEVRGREVVVYWRSLGAGQEVEFPISLVAAVPGTYTGPASRAYLYYTDEHKAWVAPLKVEIPPK